MRNLAAGQSFTTDLYRKLEQTIPRSVQQQDYKAHQGVIGTSNISPNNGGQGNHAGSERSMPRPDISQSNILPPTSHAFQAFYTPGSQPVATSSMQELSRTVSHGDAGLPTLKSPASNPNISMRWNTGSSPIVANSPDVTLRPSTSGGQRPRVNLQDIQFPTGQVAALAIKSSLGEAHHEPLDGNSTYIPAMNQPHPVPKPLHINKQQAPPAIPPRSARRHLPSPPPSVKTQSEKASSEFDRLSILEKPYVLIAAGESRPSSRGSHRNIPTSLRELMAADDPMFDTPTSVPTPPPSLPRASNENGNRASINEWGDPVIQNVRAKRETMTISAANRQSLEKMIDNFDQAASFDQDQRPRTSSGPRTSRPKPPNLKLDTRVSDWNGPNSAPFAAKPRSESPFRPKRTGVPAAAVGALGRPTRPDTRGIRRPTADEYDIAPERPFEEKSEHRSHQPVADEYDFLPGRPFEGDSDDETPPSSPESLDSPIMPVDGPLASPMLPPLSRSPAGEPRRDGLNPNFRFPDRSMSAESRSGSEASVTRPHPLQKVSSAESTNWPLPTPNMIVSDVVTLEPSSLPARAQSPFAVPSFSRPWTPTNARPGTPVRTTELTIPSGLRGPSPSPRAPPPRKTPEYALKNPHVIQEHSAADFI